MQFFKKKRLLTRILEMGQLLQLKQLNQNLNMGTVKYSVKTAGF